MGLWPPRPVGIAQAASSAARKTGDVFTPFDALREPSPLGYEILRRQGRYEKVATKRRQDLSSQSKSLDPGSNKGPVPSS